MKYLIYRETQKATDYADLANRLAADQSILRILLLEMLNRDDDQSDSFMATVSDFMANKPISFPSIGLFLTQEVSFLHHAEYLHCEFQQMMERVAQESIAQFLVECDGA